MASVCYQQGWILVLFNPYHIEIKCFKVEPKGADIWVALADSEAAVGALADAGGAEVGDVLRERARAAGGLQGDVKDVKDVKVIKDVKDVKDVKDKDVTSNTQQTPKELAQDPLLLPLNKFKYLRSLKQIAGLSVKCHEGR